MREIEFRGRDIAGNWHYGFPMVFSEDFATITKPFENNKTIEIKTLGQYTGLKDKNGTKIFEGDIVKGLYLKNSNNILNVSGVVKYDLDRFRIMGQYALNLLEVSQCEVIGNIYDNPELLEVTDD